MIPRYEEHVRPEGERSREMAEEASSRRWKGAHLMEKVRCTCMLRLVPTFPLPLSESSVFWSCWFFFFFFSWAHSLVTSQYFLKTCHVSDGILGVLVEQDREVSHPQGAYGSSLPQVPTGERESEGAEKENHKNKRGGGLGWETEDISRGNISLLQIRNI